MLCLNRKQNQSIHIGHDISVFVVESRGRVTLGVQAPRAVPVVRSELARHTGIQPVSTVPLHGRIVIDCGADGTLEVSARDVVESVRVINGLMQQQQKRRRA